MMTKEEAERVAKEYGTKLAYARQNHLPIPPKGEKEIEAEKVLFAAYVYGKE